MPGDIPVFWGRGVIEPDCAHVRETRAGHPVTDQAEDGSVIGFAICGCLLIADVADEQMASGAYRQCSRCLESLADRVPASTIHSGHQNRRRSRAELSQKSVGDRHQPATDPDHATSRAGRRMKQFQQDTGIPARVWYDRPIKRYRCEWQGEKSAPDMASRAATHAAQVPELPLEIVIYGRAA